jgi:hypothetical protein
MQNARVNTFGIFARKQNLASYCGEKGGSIDKGEG